METTVFSIDNANDLHTLSKFLRHIDTQRAMGKLVGAVELAIGAYQGEMEYSFIMLSVDYNKHVKDSGYVDNQECIMLVSSDIRQPVLLEKIATGERAKLGKLYVGKGNGDFTYKTSTGEYFHVK